MASFINPTTKKRRLEKSVISWQQPFKMWRCDLSKRRPLPQLRRYLTKKTRASKWLKTVPTLTKKSRRQHINKEQAIIIVVEVELEVVVELLLEAVVVPSVPGKTSTNSRLELTPLPIYLERRVSVTNLLRYAVTGPLLLNSARINLKSLTLLLPLYFPTKLSKQVKSSNTMLTLINRAPTSRLLFLRLIQSQNNSTTLQL